MKKKNLWLIQQNTEGIKIKNKSNQENEPNWKHS